MVHEPPAETATEPTLTTTHNPHGQGTAVHSPHAGHADATHGKATARCCALRLVRLKDYTVLTTRAALRVLALTGRAGKTPAGNGKAIQFYRATGQIELRDSRG